MKLATLKKRWWVALMAAGLTLLIWSGLRPAPVQVELGAVARGPLEAYVEEQGETRAHDRFTISAPVAGRLVRVEWHEGDRVRAGQAVATLNPLPLDPRERTEAQEKLRAAEATQRSAAELALRAQAEHGQARLDLERAEVLGREGIWSKQVLEKARSTEAAAAKDVAAAKFRAEAAASDVKAARALVESQDLATRRPVTVYSPVSGKVMRIPDQSERVVAAGAPLLILGDARKIEVVVELLSTDAVKIQPGAEARLVNWGGPAPLPAKVRTIEPSGFKKVSALGIEEQRVNVILDFAKGPGPLSDGYRVEAQIVTWRGADVIKAPLSSLFRCGAEWCVFAVRNGVARRVEVRAGQRSPQEVEIFEGLAPGDQVVLHPPNTLTDGARVISGGRA